MEQRIAALERANRQLRVAVAILFVLAVARLIVPASAQQTPDVLRAGKFEVVRNGKTMGYLGSTETGGSLDIRNPQSQLVAYIDANTNGATLGMGTGTSKELVEISVDAGGSKVDFRRGDASEGIWMRSANGSDPSINMMNGCIYVLSVRGMRFNTCQ